MKFPIGRAKTKDSEIKIEAWENGKGYNLIIRRTDGVQIIALTPEEYKKLKRTD